MEPKVDHESHPFLDWEEVLLGSILDDKNGRSAHSSQLRQLRWTTRAPDCCVWLFEIEGPVDTACESAGLGERPATYSQHCIPLGTN